MYSSFNVHDVGRVEFEGPLKLNDRYVTWMSMYKPGDVLVPSVRVTIHHKNKDVLIDACGRLNDDRNEGATDADTTTTD